MLKVKIRMMVLMLFKTAYFSETFFFMKIIYLLPLEKESNMEKSKKYAYVTFVMRNDSYIPGALVLAYCLQKQYTSADLVCLITDDITKKGKEALGSLYDHVVLVDEIFVEHRNSHQRQDRPYLFTRFQALCLGEDGGLGFDYDKIVVLDADIMPLCNYDELFDLETPAGIINESKDHFVPELPYNRSDGKWVWHDIYEGICRHGERIPSEITDRVWENPDNMGVNACIWVLTPDRKEYGRIMEYLRKPVVKNKISQFKWPEMQFATFFWSGQWYNIDLRYSAFNCQPRMDLIYGTHFAGLKPWNEKKKKSVLHYYKYEDYRAWYREFVEMVKWVYPSLSSLPRIRRILNFYERKLDVISNGE
ncbi:MAG: glycosyltransferase [bacterium]